MAGTRGVHEEGQNAVAALLRVGILVAVAEKDKNAAQFRNKRRKDPSRANTITRNGPDAEDNLAEVPTVLILHCRTSTPCAILLCLPINKELFILLCSLMRLQITSELY